ncbi:MAG: proline dehydrogenase family protein [Cyclobacteriaceae bacterium]|nr:proline dehydrogenase family protein [Cyclobacteriaceae bacterium]MDW8331995.1 proline dehydrogenase family protein [Cyclobacteriaceae bacterium]
MPNHQFLHGEQEVSPYIRAMEARPPVSFEDTSCAFAYRNDAELKRAHFIFSVVNHPWVAAMATGVVKTGLALRLPVEGIIRKTVFDHFCAGEDKSQAEEVINRLATYHVRAILDYAVEGEHTEQGFEQTTEETLCNLETAAQSANIPFCVFKPTGIASADLLEKVQQGVVLTVEEEKAYARVKERFDRICRKAHELDIPVMVDAEDSWYQDVVDRLVLEMMKKYNTQRAIVYNTYQLYRTAGLSNLRNHFHEAVMHNIFFGAKLVRGAYMEKERERAARLGYPDPIHPNKEATDNAFNSALAFCVDNKQRVSLVCGSHNEYSNYYLTVLMEKHGLAASDGRVWFAQLYGMSDHISFNLARCGYNVVKYLPYGPVRKVMPYLFRRAEENTSVAGQSSRELLLIKAELKRRRSS